MRAFMPQRRPTDAMKMHPDYPQEEELALGQERFFSFYYWFYFPRQADLIANKFMYLDDPDFKRSKEFRKHYRDFIRRCCLNTHGKVFISKNPANTARIAMLAEQFPDAWFIYLKRDPYETLQSSMIFFKSLLLGISLQDYDETEVDRFIMENYKRLIGTYMGKKALIPSDHLMEISYEELTKDPVEILSDLTDRLDLGIEPDLSKAEDYMARSRDFPRAEYRFKKAFLNEVNRNLEDLIRRQGYRVREPHETDQLKT
jgi:hypothetical protein